MENLRYIYFVGIGGIGMSAIARWFAANGKKVAGYDKTPTTLTDALRAEGMEIHFADEVEAIPAEIRQNPTQTLVVYTPAIPADHRQMDYFRKNGFEIIKRAQILGRITHHYFTIAVAGTHGKTTTSSMIAHLLRSSGVNCTAFLGGISTNYQTNLLLNQHQDTPPVVVVEADEYDRSFLNLRPDLAVVTAIEPDHLDIYGDEHSVIEGFEAFMRKVVPEGHLFLNEKFGFGEMPAERLHPYGLQHGQVAAEEIRIVEGVFHFDVRTPEGVWKNFVLQMAGFHNVENAVAAIAIGRHLGIPEADIRHAISTYTGVKRRFEYVVRGPQTYIDDYAHHPTEISAFLASVRALYPTKKLTVIFQPHLYTRTRDFADGFAESLSRADELILMPIYPARELPIPGVSSEMILDKVTITNKKIISEHHLLEYIQMTKPELLVTVGAGDIDRFVLPFKEWFESQQGVH